MSVDEFIPLEKQDQIEFRLTRDVPRGNIMSALHRPTADPAWSDLNVTARAGAGPPRHRLFRPMGFSAPIAALSKRIGCAHA